MSEQAAAEQRDPAEEEAKGSENNEAEEAEQEEEEEEDGDDAFINNHDLIGVKGIIAAQKNEIEKKKVSHCCHVC